MGKNRFIGFLVFIVMIFMAITIKAQEVTYFEPFYVYSDKNDRENHYIPSGWMGDYSDITMNDGWSEGAYAGATCIKVTYRSKSSQGARWGGVYWQNPANNWGEKNGGFDLTGAKKLTFWAKGEKGGERVEEVKMGGLSGSYPDSDIASIGPMELTKQWKKYEVNLEGKDLSYISGGFCWSTNLDVNPEGCVFYMDEIRYE